MSKENLSFGSFGESLAVEFLRNNGYKILETNYRNKLGEIDIIARDKETISFVEVKTRSTPYFGLPQEAVSFPKQRRISRAALFFLKKNKLLDEKVRFDVVAVSNFKAKPQVELIKNAFEYAYRL